MKRMLAVLCLALCNIAAAQEYTHVKNVSFVAANGDRVLRHEAIIPATLDEAWGAFASADGLKSWLAPTSMVELQTGGRYWANYRVGSTLDDQDTIRNTVLAYLPKQMMAIRLNLVSKVFPQEVIDAHTLFAVLTFEDLGNHQVKLSENVVGFGAGKDWDWTYNFFNEGNSYTFEKLYERFTKGPTDWAKAKPVVVHKQGPAPSGK